ncbi:hypothetical protein K0U91_06675 [Chryseobacterium chendengshani]|uniref:hypothetical protein n=1 Tax=Chryseobacterium sp. LJ668 TaxID=2864040 RepID=UPI001C687813|nr:hypothetical protein [Chryseobacterium sp. LJ668]MBW8522150.1 hypothetical protein [Chryseobacterium sp. LJ668]QYK17797.1 hypothetical protein K0U91_06675 [Chryseobacterium sp. LJ668]
MTSLLPENVDEHYHVIEKLLNDFLFDSFEIPSTEEKKLPLDKEFYNLYLKCGQGEEILHPELAVAFYENKIIKFLQLHLDNSEILNLTKCYNESYAKIIIHSLNEIQKKSYSFGLQYSPQDLSDQELHNLLFARRFVPINIFTYLSNLFADLFYAIKYYGGRKSIDKSNYDIMVKHYTLNYEVPTIVSKANRGIFNHARSGDIFSSDYDISIYQEWIKSIAQKQIYKVINT